MKKGIRIFWVTILIAILLGIGLLVFRLYPVYQGAKQLEQEMTFDNLTFDVTLSFAEERLKESQKNLINGLSLLTGIPAENLETVRLQGGIFEDKIYVQVTPKDSESALTEFYFSENEDYINGAMLYGRVKDHLTDQYGLLALLLPEWTGGEFLTFTQAEDMFGIDLSGVRQIHPTEFTSLFTFKKSFAMLTAMEQSKTTEGNQKFTLLKEQDGTVQSLEITFMPNEKPSIRLQSRSDDLQKTMQVIDQLLSKWKSDRSLSWKKGVQNVHSVQAELTVGDAQEIILPDSVIAQDTVNKINTVRNILQELFGN